MKIQVLGKEFKIEQSRWIQNPTGNFWDPESEEDVYATLDGAVKLLGCFVDGKEFRSSACISGMTLIQMREKKSYTLNKSVIINALYDAFLTLKGVVNLEMEEQQCSGT